MKKFAPVAPLHILRQLADADPKLVGDYLLLTADEVVADMHGWESFIHDLRWSLGEVHIILDNGVIETGVAAEIGALAVLAHTVRANVVVLPDFIGNSTATVNRAKAAKEWFVKNEPSFELMGVAQGESYDATQWCLRMLFQLDLGWYSVPKGLSERLGAERERMTQMAGWVDGHHSVHVLGFTNDLVDDMFTVGRTGRRVKGIDSAMPLWMGQQDAELPDIPVRRDFGRRPSWQSLPTAIRPTTVKNLLKVRSWLAEVERAYPDVPAGSSADSPGAHAHAKD